MEDQLAAAIDALIPKSLDDIIRANRDRMSLHLANADEIAPLTTTISTNHPAKAEIDDWRLIAATLVTGQGEHITPLYQLGNNGRLNWMTSVITGIDLPAGLVTTKSGSIYRLVGEPGEGEPCMQHLLHVCAVLHEWGVGRSFGLPHIFY